jgi:hypothetical protein
MSHERSNDQLTKDQLLKSDNDDSKETVSDKSQKPWEPMKLTHTGEAKDVVQFPGGGKLSTAPADPGDPKKPTGVG